MPGPVEITYADLQFDDQLGQVKEQSPDGSSGHTDYMVRNHFEQDKVTYAGSLTGVNADGPSVGIVRLGNPVIIWICEFTALCVGAQPTIPDPEVPPPGWTLLDAYITLPMVSEGPSARDPVYRVKGVYVYSRQNPAAKVFDQAFFPQPPWIPLSSFPRKVQADKLVKWISSPQGRGGGLDPGGPVSMPGGGNGVVTT